MIVITTSGIKMRASERIMSPAVACLVVRATSLSSQTGQTLTDLGRRAHYVLMETIQTIARHIGPRGEVVLRRRLGAGRSVDELITNGTFAMDSSESSTERMLGELAVPSGHARRVLVGGLGLGYTVAAICTKDVDVIDVVEIEECLVDWAYQGMTATLAAVASDPRVRIHSTDVRLVLEGLVDGPTGPWDAIVLDIDNGPDFLIHAENHRLYTETGLRAAYAQLAVGGTLAIWCQGPVPPLHAALQNIAPVTHEHLSEVSRGERSLQYAIYTVSRPTKSPRRPRQECAHDTAN
jgi:spermidine synthase